MIYQANRIKTSKFANEESIFYYKNHNNIAENMNWGKSNHE